jgi:glycosyltransferase involved in cell wall biosynthesis
MKPLIFYSIAAKIGGHGLSQVAENALFAIEKADLLDQVVCYGKNDISKISKINQIFFQPFKVFSFLPSKYYYSMKRYWLDLRVSYLLKKSQANIFHGWTHESLKSIQIAKSKGMLVILERGNPHPLFSQKTLKEEYAKYGKNNFFEITDKNYLLRKFNHYRYELDEAIQEIEMADYIFVNSRFCANTYTQYGVNQKKIVIIPRGFDPKNYYPRPRQTKNEKFIVLFVGELILRKGIKYLLEAWKGVSDENSELWFVGSLSDEVIDIFDRYQDKFQNIKCFGRQLEPSSFFQKASVFVFPSLDEGSAKVTYEAMASGLPCVLTENSGSMATRNSAILIRPRSSSAIKMALLKLKKDVGFRNKLGAEAVKAIQKYTWSYYQKSLINVYQKILNKSP